MKTESDTCCLCGVRFGGYGNNPTPLGRPGERCCDDCNWMHVIPARLGRLFDLTPPSKPKGKRK